MSNEIQIPFHSFDYVILFDIVDIGNYKVEKTADFYHDIIKKFQDLLLPKKILGGLPAV